VWQSLGVWERLQGYLILDWSGSVVIDEIIRQEEMVASLDVGFPELTHDRLIYLVGKKTASACMVSQSKPRQNH
jgi:hypothetical protein